MYVYTVLGERSTAMSLGSSRETEICACSRSVSPRRRENMVGLNVVLA